MQLTRKTTTHTQPSPSLCRCPLLFSALPAHTAAFRNDSAALSALLDAEPRQIHARSDLGETPLHIACAAGFLPVVRVLLTDGRAANLRSRNANGETPLHIAVQSKNKDIVEALLEAGAPTGVVDNAGDTPASKASILGDVEMLKLLQGRPQSPQASSSSTSGSATTTTTTTTTAFHPDDEDDSDPNSSPRTARELQKALATVQPFPPSTSSPSPSTSSSSSRPNPSNIEKPNPDVPLDQELSSGNFARKLYSQARTAWAASDWPTAQAKFEAALNFAPDSLAIEYHCVYATFLARVSKDLSGAHALVNQARARLPPGTTSDPRIERTLAHISSLQRSNTENPPAASWNKLPIPSAPNSKKTRRGPSSLSDGTGHPKVFLLPGLLLGWVSVDPSQGRGWIYSIYRLSVVACLVGHFIAVGFMTPKDPMDALMGVLERFAVLTLWFMHWNKLTKWVATEYEKIVPLWQFSTGNHRIREQLRNQGTIISFASVVLVAYWVLYVAFSESYASTQSKALIWLARITMIYGIAVPIVSLVYFSYDALGTMALLQDFIVNAPQTANQARAQTSQFVSLVSSFHKRWDSISFTWYIGASLGGVLYVFTYGQLNIFKVYVVLGFMIAVALHIVLRAKIRQAASLVSNAVTARLNSYNQGNPPTNSLPDQSSPVQLLREVVLAAVGAVVLAWLVSSPTFHLSRQAVLHSINPATLWTLLTMAGLFRFTYSFLRSDDVSLQSKKTQ